MTKKQVPVANFMQLFFVISLDVFNVITDKKKSSISRSPAFPFLNLSSKDRTSFQLVHRQGDLSNRP